MSELIGSPFLCIQRLLCPNGSMKKGCLLKVTNATVVYEATDSIHQCIGYYQTRSLDYDEDGL